MLVICLIIIYLVFVILNKFLVYDTENFEELTNKIDKIYYINLDRRPDRNQHFINQSSKLNMNNVIRFKGIDGLSYQFTEDDKKYV